MDNAVYFVDETWQYAKRTVNFNNFTIIYEQKGGFATKEEAENALKKDNQKYQIYSQKSAHLVLGVHFSSSLFHNIHKFQNRNRSRN